MYKSKSARFICCSTYSNVLGLWYLGRQDIGNKMQSLNFWRCGNLSILVTSVVYASKLLFAVLLNTYWRALGPPNLWPVSLSRSPIWIKYSSFNHVWYHTVTYLPTLPIISLNHYGDWCSKLRIILTTILGLENRQWRILPSNQFALSNWQVTVLIYISALEQSHMCDIILVYLAQNRLSFRLLGARWFFIQLPM